MANQKVDDTDEEEKGHADIRLVKSYGFGPDQGAVYVYEVTPHPVPGVMYLEEFYVASFSDDNLELAWGLGNSIEEALKNAMQNWEREVGNELGENPFKKALNQQEGE